MMDEQTITTVLGALKKFGIGTLDITGGAPELNPGFRMFVEEAKKTGCRVMVRTNLTIFSEKGMEDLPDFICSNSVEVVASLPCYTEDGVDGIRGKGAFKKSVDALRRLNSLGYGFGSADKKLDIVYNPSDAFLSPDQKALENDYKRALGERFGISFDRLYTFTNMPIGRFRNRLAGAGGLEKYMKYLACAFNPHTIAGLMCRSIVSVGWDGRLYDCDFNQLLDLGVSPGCPQHIRDFDPSRLAEREITVGDHCYTCTAGQGST